MGQQLFLTLNDGTRLEGNAAAPWSLREQIDWEAQHRASFSTVHLAVAKDREIALAAQAGDGGDDVPARYFRVGWMIWFAWHRLRAQGKAPGKFDTFMDQLADYDFVVTPDPEPEPVDPELVAEAPAPEASGVDPTASPSQPAPAPTEEPAPPPTGTP